MKLNSKEKKEIRIGLIKMGRVNKSQRKAFWRYILQNELSVGYMNAQELERMGIKALKPLRDWMDQPD